MASIADSHLTVRVPADEHDQRTTVVRILATMKDIAAQQCVQLPEKVRVVISKSQRKAVLVCASVGMRVCMHAACAQLAIEILETGRYH